MWHRYALFSNGQTLCLLAGGLSQQSGECRQTLEGQERKRQSPRPFHLSASSPGGRQRSEEHTSELQSHLNLVCRLLLEKKKKIPPDLVRLFVKFNTCSQAP